MQEYYRSSKVEPRKFNILVIFISILTACVLIYAFSIGERKWIMAVVAGLAATFSILLFVQNLRKYVFYICIFSLPHHINVFLYRKETSYIQLQGFPLSLFDILFLFLLVSWIFQILKKEVVFRFYPEISIPALICILFAGISITVSSDSALSLCAFLLFLKCYIIFLYFANNIRDKETIKLVLLMMILSVMLECLVSIMQYVSGGRLGLAFFGEGIKSYKEQFSGAYVLSRVGGTFGGPNNLAMYLNLLLPVFFCLLFTTMNRWAKALALIALLLGGVTEILTLSRGGWVALFIAFIFAAYFVFKQRFRSGAKSAAFIVSFGLILVAVTLLSSSQVRIRLFEDNYRSAYGRIYMSQVAWNIIKENPFLGVGINSYTSVSERYDRTPVGISYRFPYPVHNAFLLFTAECGIMATLAFIFLLFIVFRKVINIMKSSDGFYDFIGVGFACGALTYIIQSQFEPIPLNRYALLWFNLAMITSFHNIIVNRVKPTTSHSSAISNGQVFETQEELGEPGSPKRTEGGGGSK